MQAYSRQEPHSCYELYLASDSKSERYQYLMNGQQTGEMRCLYELANHYIEGGDGIEPDHPEAFGILEDLCKKKYPPGFFLKAKMHAMPNTEFSNA